MTNQRIFALYTVFKSGLLLMLTIAVLVPLLILWPMASRLNKASSQLLDCTVIVDGQAKGNAACLQSQILAITGSTRATMGAVAKAAPQVAEAVRSASSNSVSASQASIDTAKAATHLLDSSTSAVDELHATIHDLHFSVNELVKSAGPVMTQLTDLEKTLDQQFAEQSPEVGKTLQAMQRLLDDPALLDTIQHLDATSANVQEGTEHLAETVKTIDLATRDLRKKAGQVKWLIEKILNIIKVTVPLF